MSFLFRSKNRFEIEKRVSKLIRAGIEIKGSSFRKEMNGE